MKIKTEILQSIYLITCEGPRLNPSSVEVFLNAMKALIQRNQLDILFDLSGLELVEGAKLGTIFRALDAIEGHGRVMICGVSERELNVLKMTHLQEKFLQATDRDEALSTLFRERKKTPPTPPEPPASKEEPAKLPEAEDRQARKVPKKAKEEESVYEVKYLDMQLVTGDDPESEKGEGPEAEEIADQPLTAKERRKFSRIKGRLIMDGDFIIFCRSTVTRKHYTAVVEDIGLGGLRMTLSPPRIAEDEELILEGRIGKSFKFKETAVFHSRRQEKFVFEFVDLSSETTLFLGRLAASLNK